MSSQQHRGPAVLLRRTDEFRSFVQAFGARVRELRQERGWSLEVAAEACSMGWQHLQKIETGRSNWTAATLMRISAGLGCRPEALFAGVDVIELPSEITDAGGE